MPQLQAVGHSATAEEIKRIVEVAEYLGEDPQIVRNALEDEDHEVPTDQDLADAIDRVERKLTREERRLGAVTPGL